MENNQSVYSFELHFLEALKGILSFEDAQTLVFGDGEIKDGPRIEIGLSVSGVNTSDRGLLPNGSQYLSRYGANLTIQVFTQRDANTHFYLVGSVRSSMSYIYPKLTQSKLPYQVKGLYEQSSQNGLSNERDDEIVTTLSYNLDFCIPAESLELDDGN